MAKIGVVIPILINTNEQVSMTWKCIELARKKTKIPFELIIVESGNSYFSDNCDIYVHEKEVTTPEISHNRGFRIAGANDFICLLTNDVFVSDNWLEVLCDTFNHREDCGAATLASTQFNHQKQDLIEEGNWWSVALIKKEIFQRVGYYDERFINSWCDTDLLIRMYKHGYKMYRNYNCVVDHLRGRTVYDKPSFSQDYANGQKLFQEKHDGCGLAVYEAYK